MSPILLYFVSGESLYLGVALLLVMVVISPYLERGWPMRLRNVISWLALVMMVMASPPFAWAVDLIFGVVFLLWFVAWNTALGGTWTRRRSLTTVVLVALLLTASAAEFWHRKMPEIRGAACDHLVVIGDSISSGLDARVPAWPALMQQATGTDVANLSRPGATISDGLAMAKKVNPQDHLVLIELGGNDMIAGAGSGVFARGLEAILAKLAEPGRTIVMFELPLLPHKIAYGQIQRRLAAKYGVWLIPKRCLTEVISGKDATSDGLHLTNVGAGRMATAAEQVLSPVLLTQSHTSTAPATHP